MKLESLAWRKFPEPEGIDYLESDLKKISKAIELFDYCQILEAAIWKKGWCFLFEHYGLKGIIEIDKESGWLDDDDLGEWITSIYYQALISGFDPEKKEFGNYSEEKGIFTNKYGIKRKIDWKQIYDLKEKLEAEILLHNGFPNHGGDGDLLVGVILNGQISKDAFLLIEDREIKMSKIEIREDLRDNVTRIEFEVNRKIDPPVNWWKLYNTKIKVKNTTYNTM